AVHQGYDINAEDILQLGLGKKIVEQHFARFVALDLNHNAQAVFIGFVAQLADALDFLLFHQFGNAFNQTRLVQLVRNLVHDNGFAPGLGIHLDFGLGANVNASTSGAIRLHNTGPAVDNGTGGEIGTGDVFHQLINGDVFVVDQGQATAHHFGQ